MRASHPFYCVWCSFEAVGAPDKESWVYNSWISMKGVLWLYDTNDSNDIDIWLKSILMNVDWRWGEWKHCPGTEILFQRFDDSLHQGTDRIKKTACLYKLRPTWVMLGQTVLSLFWNSSVLATSAAVLDQLTNPALPLVDSSISVCMASKDFFKALPIPQWTTLGDIFVIFFLSLLFSWTRRYHSTTGPLPWRNPGAITPGLHYTPWKGRDGFLWSGKSFHKTVLSSVSWC